MASHEEGFSLHVTVHIAAEDVPKFLEAFRPVYEKVSAEPECTFFEVYQSPEDPGTLSWVENWSGSAEWFMKNQLTKDYYTEYFKITEPMFTKPREFRIVKRLKGYMTVKNAA